MGLISLPDPVSMFEAAANGKLEREAANALVSSSLSGWISFLWTLGKKSLFGLGPALQAMATAQFLSLRELETKNFIVLTVPTELLTADNISQYETEKRI